MVKCRNCNTSAKQEDLIKCENCSNYFHLYCVNVAPGTWKQMGENKRKAWKCPIVCRTRAKSQQEPEEEADDSQTINNISIGNVSQTILDEIRSFREEFRDMKQSLEFIASRYDELNKDFQLEKAKSAENQKKIEMLETENKALISEVDKIKNEINRQDQYGRRFNIEINNVDLKQGEDIPGILRTIATKLKIPHQDSDVEVTHRLKPKVNSKYPPGIIVQFCRKAKRNEWLMTKKQTLKNSDIFENGNGGKIFINENLTGTTKQLLWQCKQTAQRNNFKYTWVKNGSIFIRKSDSTDAVLIQNNKDLIRLEKSTNLLTNIVTR